MALLNSFSNWPSDTSGVLQTGISPVPSEMKMKRMHFHDGKEGHDHAASFPAKEDGGFSVGVPDPHVRSTEAEMPEQRDNPPGTPNSPRFKYYVPPHHSPPSPSDPNSNKFSSDASQSSKNLPKPQFRLIRGPEESGGDLIPPIAYMPSSQPRSAAGNMHYSAGYALKPSYPLPLHPRAPFRNATRSHSNSGESELSDSDHDADQTPPQTNGSFSSHSNGMDVDGSTGRDTNDDEVDENDQSDEPSFVLKPIPESEQRARPRYPIPPPIPRHSARSATKSVDTPGHRTLDANHRKYYRDEPEHDPTVRRGSYYRDASNSSTPTGSTTPLGPSTSHGTRSSTRTPKRRVGTAADSEDDNDDPDEDYSESSGPSGPSSKGKGRASPSKDGKDRNSKDRDKDKPSRKKKRKVGRFKCTEEGCNETFTRKNDVLRHIKNAAIHRAIAPPDATKKCQYCGIDLSRSDARARHERVDACGRRQRQAKEEKMLRKGRDEEDNGGSGNGGTTVVPAPTPRS